MRWILARKGMPEKEVEVEVKAEPDKGIYVLK